MNYIKDLAKRFFPPGPGGAGVSAGFIFFFAAALCVYAVTVCSPPSFEPRLSLYVDQSSIYWMQAFWNPALFRGDPMASFYLSHIGPLKPESAWVWLTTLFFKVHPYTSGLKLLSVLACAASALMVRRLALASPARPAAGAAAILFTVYFLSMDTFFGVPRVYGVLIFLGFAWALEAGRFLLLPALIALCFVFYPAASVGLAVSGALVPFFFRKEFSAGRLLPRYLTALAAGAVFCLLVLSQSVALKNLPQAMGAGSVFQDQKLYQMVDAPISPRNPMDAVLYFALNINEHGRLYALFTALLVLVCFRSLLAVPKRPFILPRSVPALLAGCGAAFLLLYPFHPVSASRQAVFIIPLTLVFLAAGGFMATFRERFRAVAAAAVCAALFLVLHPRLNATFSMRGFREAYGFIGGLPEDSVIAGYPSSDFIYTVPVFAGRRIFLSDNNADQEMLLLGGLESFSRRRISLLEALYCARPDASARLAAEHGAAWLLFEKQYYTEEFLAKVRKSAFPGDQRLAALFAAGADPAACYAAASGKAAFAWRNGSSEGFAVPPAAAAEGHAAK